MIISKHSTQSVVPYQPIREGYVSDRATHRQSEILRAILDAAMQHTPEGLAELEKQISYFKVIAVDKSWMAPMKEQLDILLHSSREMLKTIGNLRSEEHALMELDKEILGIENRIDNITLDGMIFISPAYQSAYKGAPVSERLRILKGQLVELQEKYNTTRRSMLDKAVKLDKKAESAYTKYSKALKKQSKGKKIKASKIEKARIKYEEMAHKAKKFNESTATSDIEMLNKSVLTLEGMLMDIERLGKDAQSYVDLREAQKRSMSPQQASFLANFIDSYNAIVSAVNPNTFNRMLTPGEVANLDMYTGMPDDEAASALAVIRNNDLTPLSVVLTASAYKTARLPIPKRLGYVVDAMHKLGVYGTDANRKLYMSHNAEFLDDDIQAARSIVGSSWSDIRLNGTLQLLPEFNNSEFNTLKDRMQMEGTMASHQIIALWSTRSADAQQQVRNYIMSSVNKMQGLINGIILPLQWQQMNAINLWDSVHDCPYVPRSGHFTIAIQHFDLYAAFGAYVMEDRVLDRDTRMEMLDQCEALMRILSSQEYRDSLSLLMAHIHIVSEGKDASHPQAMILDDFLENLHYVYNTILNGSSETFYTQTAASGSHGLMPGRRDATHGSNPSQDDNVEMRVMNPFYIGIYFHIVRPALKPHKAANRDYSFLKLSCPESKNEDCLAAALLAKEPHPTDTEIEAVNLLKCSPLETIMSVVKSVPWVIVQAVYSDNTWLITASEDKYKSIQPAEFDRLAGVKVIFNRRGHIWNVDNVDLMPKSHNYIYKQWGRYVLMKERSPQSNGVEELLIGGRYQGEHIICFEPSIAKLACLHATKADPLCSMDAPEFITAYVAANAAQFKQDPEGYTEALPSGVPKTEPSKWQQGVEEERRLGVYGDYSTSVQLPRRLIICDKDTLQFNRCGSLGLPEVITAEYLREHMQDIIILAKPSNKALYWRVVDILEPEETIYTTAKLYKSPTSIRDGLLKLKLATEEQLLPQESDDIAYVKALAIPSVIISTFRHMYDGAAVTYSHNTLHVNPRGAMKEPFTDGLRFFERDKKLYIITCGHTWYRVMTKLMVDASATLPIYAAFDFETGNCTPSKEYFRRVYKTVPLIAHLCYVTGGYDSQEVDIKYKRFEGPLCSQYLVAFLKQLQDEEGRMVHLVGFNNSTFDNHLITAALSSILSWGSHKRDNCLLIHGAKLNAIVADKLTIHDMRNITLGSLDRAARDNKIGASKTIWDHRKTQELFEAAGCDTVNMLERLKGMAAVSFIPKPTLDEKCSKTSAQVREYKDAMEDYTALTTEFKDSNAYDAFHEYCRNDTKVTLLLFLRVAKVMEAMSGGIRLESISTLSEFAWKLFKKNLPEDPIPGKPHQLIELPKINEEELYREIHQWLVVGGRSEVTDEAPYGVHEDGSFERYMSVIIDVTSLYPYVGLTGTFPKGKYRKVLPEEQPLPIGDMIGIYKITITRQAYPCHIALKATHAAYTLPGVDGAPPRSYPVGSNCYDYPAGIDGHGTYDAMVFGEDIIIHRMNGGECIVHYGYVWEEMSRDYFLKTWYKLRDSKMEQDRLREEDMAAKKAIDAANAIHKAKGEPLEVFVQRYNPTKRNMDKITSNGLFGKTCERPPPHKVEVARGEHIDEKLLKMNATGLLTERQAHEALLKAAQEGEALPKPTPAPKEPPKTFLLPLVACTDAMGATQQLMSKKETHLIITKMDLHDYYSDPKLMKKIKAIILGASILCLSMIHMYSAAISRFGPRKMRMAQETDSEHLRDVDKYEASFLQDGVPIGTPWMQPPQWHSLQGLYNCTLFRWLLEPKTYPEHAPMLPIGTLCVPELMVEWNKKHGTKDAIPAPDYGQFKPEGAMKERDLIYIAKKMYHEETTEDGVDKDRAKGIGKRSISADELLRFDETMQFYRVPYNQAHVRQEIAAIVARAPTVFNTELFKTLGKGKAVDTCDFLFGGMIGKAKQEAARGGQCELDAFGLCYSLPIKRIQPSRRYQLVLRCDQQSDIEKWVLSMPPRTEPSETNKLHAYRYRTELVPDDIVKIVMFIDAHVTDPIQMRGFNCETSAGLCYVSAASIKFIYTHRKYFTVPYSIPEFIFNEGKKYLRQLAKKREEVQSGKIDIKDAAAHLLIGHDKPLGSLPLEWNQ